MPSTIHRSGQIDQIETTEPVERKSETTHTRQANALESLATTDSGNIFGELGQPSPDVHLLKAEISMRIEELIDAEGLTQEQAARRMGITQPDVSEIVRGTVRGYTLDRLVNCLLAMGQSIEVQISRSAKVEPAGHISVTH